MHAATTARAILSRWQRPEQKTSPPLVDMPSSAPIACTLTDGEAEQRWDEWAKLLAKATRRQRTSDGVAVSFPPGGDVARELSALVIAEQACCQFFDFTIRLAHDQTQMIVRAPLDAQPMVEALFDSSREAAS